MTDILIKTRQFLAKAAHSARFSANDMPLRDVTGECEGECRDRVREGELQRQKEINLSSIEEIGAFPSVKGAFTRNEPPGFLGGHV